MARLLSVNVGLPRDITWRGRTVHTSIWKQPVQSRCTVRRLNIRGDGQGDLVGHGGEQRAIFVYQMDSYHRWEARLGRHDFTYGQFSENFTVDGLSDEDVCIGDRYRVGRALLEVTQPRVTCYRIGIRMNEPRMAALLTSSGRPGFYFRVLQEGEVGAGDDIVKVADGPERMTIAAINALLYFPGHAAGQLERALRIPALSPGWRASFLTLLQHQQSGRPMTGNPGLAPASPPPGWTGFRLMRVTGKRRESGSVVSFDLEATDRRPLVVPLPGQFVVLRLRPVPNVEPLLRSYSLSGAPNAERYRVSVKLEPHGAASTYLDARITVDDVVEVSAPRGDFTLQPGTGPVVLLSAGIGATPMMAMLHALAAENSSRDVWWLFGARNGAEHPFAGESRHLLNGLSHGRCYLQYSRPRPDDRQGSDYDAPGRFSVQVLEALDVPREADFYLCGPPAFLTDLTRGLESWDIPGDHIHTEIFGPGRSSTPGITGESPPPPPHQPPGSLRGGPRVSFARSSVTTGWGTEFQNLLELAEACDVPVKWSCRTGVCHSCESGLIAGAVSYDPIPLEPSADGTLLTCCSRPHTDVIIDL